MNLGSERGDDHSEFYFRNLVSGIPGWHFQDFQIIKSVLAITTIYMAGQTSWVYPHHEFIYRISNRGERRLISHQSEKKPKWIHLSILKIKSEKMSNSRGNAITISDFLNKYSPNSLKILLLGEHYDKDFSFDKRKLSEAILIDNEISSYFMSEYVKNGKLIETLNKSDNKNFPNFWES